MNTALKGLRILNTRPINQAKELSYEIEAFGGISIECPTIEILHHASSWPNDLKQLRHIQHAIFISANAVIQGICVMKKKSISWPNSINTIAIGHATARCLERNKIPVHDIAINPDSEHLLALPCLQQVNAQHILLFKGLGGRKIIEEELKARGAHLTLLEVYKRVVPKLKKEFITSLWREDAVDIILLTSEQSMQHLFRLFSDQAAHSWLLDKHYVVISERIATCALALGIRKITICHPNRIVQTLIENKDLIHDYQ